MKRTLASAAIIPALLATVALSGCSKGEEQAAPTPTPTTVTATPNEKTGDDGLCDPKEDFPTIPQEVSEFYNDTKAREGGCWAVRFARDYTYTDLMAKTKPSSGDFEALRRKMTNAGQTDLDRYITQFAKDPRVGSDAWKHLEALTALSMNDGKHTFDDLAKPTVSEFIVNPTDMSADRKGENGTPRMSVTLNTTATIPMLNTVTKKYDIYSYERLTTYWIAPASEEGQWAVDEWAAQLDMKQTRHDLTAEQANLVGGE